MLNFTIKNFRLLNWEAGPTRANFNLDVYDDAETPLKDGLPSEVVTILHYTNCRLMKSEDTGWWWNNNVLVRDFVNSRYVKVSTISGPLNDRIVEALIQEYLKCDPTKQSECTPDCQPETVTE